MIKIRSGVGYDIHRLVPGAGLMLGGIKVAQTLRAEAHSDGDVLIHSLIDALLGAWADPTSVSCFRITIRRTKGSPEPSC